jgi:hypothetical protein
MHKSIFLLVLIINLTIISSVQADYVFPPSTVWLEEYETLRQAVEWDNWNSDGSPDYVLINWDGASRFDGTGYSFIGAYNGRDSVVQVTGEEGIRLILDGPLTTPDSGKQGIRIQMTNVGDALTGFHFLSGYWEFNHFDTYYDYGIVKTPATDSIVHADGWITYLYEIPLIPLTSTTDLALYPIYNSYDDIYIEQVYVENYATPIPSAAYLFVSGLLGFLVFVKKRTKTCGIE